MDFKKLAQVGSTKIADSKSLVNDENRKKVIDALKKRVALKKAADARKSVIADSSKKYSVFKITDSYKALKKKIKDDLEETQSTDEAVECALNELTPDTPAEQVLAAVVETLGETIDDLEEQVSDPIEE